MYNFKNGKKSSWDIPWPGDGGQTLPSWGRSTASRVVHVGDSLLQAKEAPLPRMLEAQVFKN